MANVNIIQATVLERKTRALRFAPIEKIITQTCAMHNTVFPPPPPRIKSVRNHYARDYTRESVNSTV